MKLSTNAQVLNSKNIQTVNLASLIYDFKVPEKDSVLKTSLGNKLSNSVTNEATSSRDNSSTCVTSSKRHLNARKALFSDCICIKMYFIFGFL